MNIFIGENEDKDKVYDRLFNTLDTIKFKNEIGNVFKKANNNYVGYHLFKENEQFYKIFVLPKHIKVPSTTEGAEAVQAIKEFVDYLKVYYNIKVKYPEYQPKSLNIKSSFDLAFESKQDNSSAQDIEQFVFMKYRVILQDILKFFDTHKSHKKVQTDYISQTIKHKINLVKNIKEINKTKIHQNKSEDMIFSQIATLTYGVVKIFIKQKVNLIKSESDKEILFRLATKLKNILQKKYNIDKGFELNISKLLMSKNFKPFQKSQMSKQLYSNLLSLFGIENFYDEKENKELNRSIQSESFFIRPEKLYEWIVYDNLIEHYQKDIIKKEFVSTYTLKSTVSDSKEIESKPDVVLINNKQNSVYVIDAKWKMLGSNIPDTADILKLKRDCETLSKIYKVVYAMLVYPHIEKNGYFQEYLHGSKSESTFNFYVHQLDVDARKKIHIDEIDNRAFKNPLIESFDNKLFRISKRKQEQFNLLSNEIASYIDKNYSEDNIFEHYKQIKDFLESGLDISDRMEQLIKMAVKVVYYLDNLSENYLDYTLPASSIWKAIETELKEPIRSMIGDMSYYKEQITLGTYKLIFSNIERHKNKKGNRGDTYRAFHPLLDLLSKDASLYKELFNNLTDDRNLYTHEEIMNKEDFKESILKDIFSSSENKANIIDIIKLKTIIQEYKKTS